MFILYFYHYRLTTSKVEFIWNYLQLWVCKRQTRKREKTRKIYIFTSPTSRSPSQRENHNLKKNCQFSKSIMFFNYNYNHSYRSVRRIFISITNATRIQLTTTIILLFSSTTLLNVIVIVLAARLRVYIGNFFFWSKNLLTNETIFEHSRKSFFKIIRKHLYFLKHHPEFFKEDTLM